MPDTQAVAPNNMEFLRFMKEIRKADKKANASIDSKIATVADAEGWADLKEWLLRRKSRLVELKGYDLEGASYEEMGKLFYFARLVGEEIDAIISKVENTKKVVDGL